MDIARIEKVKISDWRVSVYVFSEIDKRTSSVLRVLNFQLTFVPCGTLKSPLLSTVSFTFCMYAGYSNEIEKLIIKGLGKTFSS